MEDFSEIRPYEAGEMQQAFKELLSDRQFNKMMKGLVPWLPKCVRNGLLRLAFIGVKTPLQFQMRFMKPAVKYIIWRHTDACKLSDYTLRNYEKRYTFISNHRDIVLDSALLDVLLIKKGYPTTVEIGIGDNLLIYPWIKRLVRMNKAFIVRRSLSAHEMLQSSQLMSRYIHHAVNDKRENIWIAQREGRAKDSDDRTQESVLKMLAMGGEGASPAEKLSDLNIVPLAISYEFDPCDYLKAKEFQLKRDNPGYKKTRQDDLENMRVGIFGYKGRVVYSCGEPINEFLRNQRVKESGSQDDNQHPSKNAFYRTLASQIDHEIHSNYCIFANNYCALDMLNGDNAQSARYTASERKTFEEYIEKQLAKIDLPNKDEAFLRKCMLTMYANPLKNYLATQE